VAFQKQDYRQARNHLDRSLALRFGVPDAGTRELIDRIDWGIRPRLENTSRFFSDSNGRTQFDRSASFVLPLNIPVDFRLSASRTSFAESGLDRVDATGIRAGLSWALVPGVRFEGESMRRLFNRTPDTNSHWLRLNFGSPLNQVELSWSIEDVETVSAFEEAVQWQGPLAAYRFATGSFSGQMMVRSRRISDGNSRQDARVTFNYRLGSSAWQIGTILERSNTRFHSSLYYTPTELTGGQIRLAFREELASSLSIDGAVGVGGASDSSAGGRTLYNGRLGLTKTWAERVRANVSVDYSRVPGYRSMSVQGGINLVIK
jgi:hypothetical protein